MQCSMQKVGYRQTACVKPSNQTAWKLTLGGLQHKPVSVELLGSAAAAGLQWQS